MSNLFNTFKNKKWLAVTVAVAVILISAGFLFAGNTRAAQIQTAEVVSLDLAETVEAAGTLESQPFAALNWKTAGVVESVNAKVGQKVKKGDVLLTLQPDSTSASAASAQADLVEAQKNLEDAISSDSELAQATIDLRDAQREFNDSEVYLKYLQTSKNVPQTESRGWYEMKEVVGWTYVWKTRYFKGPATEAMLIDGKNDLELARAKLEDLKITVENLQDKEQKARAAQSKVDAAQATVNSMRIVAPFDGKILWVSQSAGDVVGAGELSVNMADMENLYVEVNVDESDIANIKMGNITEITLDTMPGVAYAGKVAVIDPAGDVVSSMVKYAVRIDLDPVKDKTFVPLGATANAVIMLKNSAVTLAVPIAAIQNDSQGEYVWVVQDNGAAKRVDVSSGAIAGDLVVVSGKLRAGDLVQLPERESTFKAPNPFGGKQK